MLSLILASPTQQDLGVIYRLALGNNCFGPDKFARYEGIEVTNAVTEKLEKNPS